MPLTEKDIIDIITKGQLKAPAHYGIGDDGSLTRGGYIVTHDTMIEGVHFNDRLSPSDLGWKIVAINVSDVAAMGHFPEWATLSLSVPSTIEDDWLRAFARGLRKALKNWNINLIGGDTTRSNHQIILSMAMGSRRTNHTVWQNGAEAGDDIWVTGTLGNAAYGFFHEDSTVGINTLQRPNPPVRFASALASFNVLHSMTDISDGLQKDLHNLCQASGVGAVIEPDSIPKGSELWQHKNAMAYVTSFGEDYEMLFTCYPGIEELVRQTARLHSTRVTKIGKIIAKESRIELRGLEWPPSLFDHF